MADEVVEILEEDELLRRLSPESHFKSDKKRVTHGALKFGKVYDNALSVHVRRLLQDPQDVAAILSEDRLWWAIGVFTAGDLMKLGLKVRHDPTDEDYSHAVVEGDINDELADRILGKLTLLKPPGTRPVPTP